MIVSSSLEPDEPESLFAGVPTLGLRPFLFKEQPLEGDIERSQAEMDALIKRMSFLYKVLSGSYDIEVLPSPTNTWACGVNPDVQNVIREYLAGTRDTLDDLPKDFFRPTQFYYNVEEIQRSSEDVVLGSMRHELGHLLHTNYRLFFEGQKFAADNGYPALVWALVFNGLEDPWINNLQIADSVAARRRIERVYQEWQKETSENIETQTPLLQLSLSIIQHWLTSNPIPTLTNEIVNEAFADFSPLAERYFVGESAEENFTLLKNEIWPHIADFFDKQREGESLRILGEVITEFDGEDITGQADDSIEPAEDIDATGFSTEVLPRLRDAEVEDDLRDLKEDIQECADPELIQKTKNDLEASEIASAENTDESGNDRKDLDDVKKILDSLSEKGRSALRRIVNREMEKKLKNAISGTMPKGLEVLEDPETGQQYVGFSEAPAEEDGQRAQNALTEALGEAAKKEEAEKMARAKAEEAAAAEKRRKEAEAQKKREMIQAGFKEHEGDLYRTYKELEDAMAQKAATFATALRPYLPKIEEYPYSGEHPSGNRLALPDLGRKIATGDYRLFERRNAQKSDRPALVVKVLIDITVSMSTEALAESLKTGIFFAKQCEIFQVPLAIEFFGEEIVPIKSYDVPFERFGSHAKAEMMRKGVATHNSTDIGTPLVATYGEMLRFQKESPQTQGAILMISDGSANAGLVGNALKSKIQEINSRFPIINFFLSGDPFHIAETQNIFGKTNVVATSDFHTLPDRAFIALRDIFQRNLRAGSFE